MKPQYKYWQQEFPWKHSLMNLLMNTEVDAGNAQVVPWADISGGDLQGVVVGLHSLLTAVTIC